MLRHQLLAVERPSLDHQRRADDAPHRRGLRLCGEELEVVAGIPLVQRGARDLVHAVVPELRRRRHRDVEEPGAAFGEGAGRIVRRERDQRLHEARRRDDLERALRDADESALEHEPPRALHLRGVARDEPVGRRMVRAQPLGERAPPGAGPEGRGAAREVGLQLGHQRLAVAQQRGRGLRQGVLEVEPEVERRAADREVAVGALEQLAGEEVGELRQRLARGRERLLDLAQQLSRQLRRELGDRPGEQRPAAARHVERGLGEHLGRALERGRGVAQKPRRLPEPPRERASARLERLVLPQQQREQPVQQVREVELRVQLVRLLLVEPRERGAHVVEDGGEVHVVADRLHLRGLEGQSHGLERGERGLDVAPSVVAEARVVGPDAGHRGGDGVELPAEIEVGPDELAIAGWGH